ncbi:cytochrome c1 [Yoonia sediminilitoris]|uniref:Cytochrome c1 n=1 Tax=Yoonia sediminilitoris TaxID=1286148 RepID=A0A2T6KH60_9RHOB|nr:cytochrome c1 [Yoonia sediminilitoris]PUB14853.1 ubiquinol-cytochrome c reductase cytochrome c1 subunit [Yoonia sediminilitoris]RCW95570.1 ubiquinol-cytochrome c reductase cytochrome c1 subunit [Yoonia sediminilitoris]
MFRKLTLTAVTTLAMATAPAIAAEVETEIEDYAFSFEGPFGSFDQMQLQRGLQVYTEICSACHGLELVAFRNLHDEGGPGLPEDQMRAYAEFYEVFDQSLFDGEGDFRPATPADKFPSSSLSNAPDLSLMAKARAGFHGPAGTGINQLVKGMGGAEYIASLMTGYHEEPECAADANMDGQYNVAFAAGGFPASCIDEHGHHMVPGSWISMSQPLYGDDVEYADGHSTDLEHVAQDVAAFLMWTAEPKMMARKQAGLTGVLFLTVLTVLLYLTNKRLWAPHKKKH